MTKADGTFRLWLEQSGDVIYITHPDYATRKLTRFGNTNWQISTLDVKAGPFIGVLSSCGKRSSSRRRQKSAWS